MQVFQFSSFTFYFIYGMHNRKSLKTNKPINFIPFKSVHFIQCAQSCAHLLYTSLSLWIHTYTIENCSHYAVIVYLLFCDDDIPLVWNIGQNNIILFRADSHFMHRLSSLDHKHFLLRKYGKKKISSNDFF